MLEAKIAKAETLLEALPYIKKFAGATVLIKFGGSLMVNEELKQQFARDIVLLRFIGMNPVIVHGGGKEISKWMQKVGKEAIFIDGLRVTDSETMELTEMVLSGKITNEIVSLINQHGGKALALSGKSGNLYIAEKIESEEDKDLGFVGRIKSVDSTLIKNLCQDEFIPVVSSVGSDGNGGTLNLNADNVASALAQHLNAEKLIFLTDVQGIMLGGKLKKQLSLADAIALKSHDEITGGMIPKLECAISAIENQVKQVHIIDGAIEHVVLLELFTDAGIGTMIQKELK